MEQSNPISEAFFENYALLCASPLREQPEIAEELITLLNHPFVVNVAFYDNGYRVPNTLIVGTKDIILRSKEDGRRHRIGAFQIFLTRTRIGRIWEVDFRLRNVNGAQTSMYEGALNPDGESPPVDMEFKKNYYMHPHMVATRIEDYPFPVAEICISAGQYQIFQHIRKGEMHRAVELIVDLLHSLGPDAAYLDLECWPVYKEPEEEVA